MKTIRTVLLSLLTICSIMSFAFADVAVLPARAAVSGFPVVVVIIIIALSIAIRSAKKAKEQDHADRKDPKTDACMDPNAENERAKKTDWDHLDPWDLDRK